MALDPLFSFGFVNAMLSTFPRPLAVETERLTKDAGFEMVLVSLLQSSEARKFIHRAFAAALNEAKQNPAKLQETRRKVHESVSVGCREPPRLIQ